ncbi:MAG: fused MFS/spermidine synthase [Anaerolineae bacterium]|nr:fused MFS/spermidine synthase [Anaerolineae bacterium]
MITTTRPQSAPAAAMLSLAVFTSGMTTLAVELTASRLLGNLFGTSNLVWANVIGLILLYLTAGYFLGGRIADHWPYPLTLYRLVAWGAFLCGLVPFAARPVLGAAAGAVAGFQAGVAIGSFVAVLVLFAVPVTLLGCVSPVAIRLAVRDVGESGRAAGRLYAISTLGSLIGTFLPVLWLIPEAGTTGTFLIFSGILLAVGLLGMALQGPRGRRAALRHAWMPLALVALAVFVAQGPLRPPPENTRLLFEKDSPYNYIQVVEYTTPIGRMVDDQFVMQWDAGTRILLLNEGQGIHSIYHPADGFYGGTWDMFLAAPYFNAPAAGQSLAPRRLAIVGLAAGTIAVQYTSVFGPDVAIDGIEIDPDIVEAGRRYFGMDLPNLNAIVEDGRLGLRQTGRRYDVVAIDAYRVPYVPWHLTTLEFFREVRDRLTERGVAVINVGRTVNSATGMQDRRLVEAMTNTMLHVFPTVHTLDVPGSFNTILVATMQPTDPANVALNRALLPAGAPPLLRTVLDTAVGATRPTVASDVLFTDDRAPVETIVNSMMFDFLTGGGAGQLAR